MTAADRVVIACNYLEATSACRRGALAFVSQATGGDIGRVRVLARSRGGRWVCRWEPLRLLGNFRPKTLPAGHPLHGDPRVLSEFRSGLERCLGGLRFYSAGARASPGGTQPDHP